MAHLTAEQRKRLDELQNYEPALKKNGLAATDIKLGSQIGSVEDKIDGDADGLNLVRVARATYDFAEHGGAISTIGLGVTLPDNAIILDGMIDVLTTVITAGADAGTLAVQANAANDIVTAIAVSDVSNPWDAGLHAIIPLGTAATAVKLTADREIKVVIGGQVVTAGKFVVLLRYVMPE